MGYHYPGNNNNITKMNFSYIFYLYIRENIFFYFGHLLSIFSHCVLLDTKEFTLMKSHTNVMSVKTNLKQKVTFLATKESTIKLNHTNVMSVTSNLHTVITLPSTRESTVNRNHTNVIL